MSEETENPFLTPEERKEAAQREQIAQTQKRCDAEEVAMYQLHGGIQATSSPSRSTTIVGPMTYAAFCNYGGLSNEQQAAVDGRLITRPEHEPNNGFGPEPGLRPDDRERVFFEVDKNNKVTRAYKGIVMPSLRRGDLIDKGPDNPPLAIQADEPPEVIVTETMDLRNVDTDKLPVAKKVQLNLELGPAAQPTAPSMNRFEMNKPEPVFPQAVNDQLVSADVPPGPQRALALAQQQLDPKICAQMACAELNPTITKVPDGIPVSGKGAGKGLV